MIENWLRTKSILTNWMKTETKIEPELRILKLQIILKIFKWPVWVFSLYCLLSSNYLKVFVSNVRKDGLFPTTVIESKKI